MVVGGPILRTHYETLMEVRYAARFNELNSRFYRHLRTTLTVLAVLFGSAAVVGFLKDMGLLTASGIFLAIVAALTVGMSPADRAVQFQEKCRRYVELEARSSKLDDHAFEAAMLELRASPIPAAIESLGNGALNDVFRANGHDALIVPLSRWERFITFLA